MSFSICTAISLSVLQLLPISRKKYGSHKSQVLGEVAGGKRQEALELGQTDTELRYKVVETVARIIITKSGKLHMRVKSNRL